MKPIKYETNYTFVYDPGDSEEYYLTDRQIEDGIKYLIAKFDISEQLTLTIEFIRRYENLKREYLLKQEKVNMSNLLLSSNKLYRKKFGDWIHYNNPIYKDFYNYINGGKKNE